MSRAILTIDDSPTAITPRLVDFLCERGVVPVLNVIGAAADAHRDELQYAIQRGAILGNHSYSHDAFSTLTLDACRLEIRRTEEILDDAYARAGMERKYRVFRFPYGDMGGENAAPLQAILRDEFRFGRLDTSMIDLPWWHEEGFDTCVHMPWTFDFIEYRLPWNDGYTWDSIMTRIHDPHPKQGGALLAEGATNIVLMHDSEATDAFLPGYYQKLIDTVTALGVTFAAPTFMDD